jgi:ribosome-dependent ATPase
MLNFLLMCAMAVFVFGVPITGSFHAGAGRPAVLHHCHRHGAAGLGRHRSQIAAMFFAMLGTMIPATQFSGLTDPVSSLEGAGRWIGEIYPATHMFTISRGVFSKALGLHDLAAPCAAAAGRRIMGAIWALPKQDDVAAAIPLWHRASSPGIRLRARRRTNHPPCRGAMPCCIA